MEPDALDITHGSRALKRIEPGKHELDVVEGGTVCPVGRERKMAEGGIDVFYRDRAGLHDEADVANNVEGGGDVEGETFTILKG